MNEQIDRAIREMANEPGSSVRMCHEQGKTAVYLSSDGKSIVRHHPDGTIRHSPLPGAPEPTT